MFQLRHYDLKVGTSLIICAFSWSFCLVATEFFLKKHRSAVGKCRRYGYHSNWLFFRFEKIPASATSKIRLLGQACGFGNGRYCIGDVTIPYSSETGWVCVYITSIIVRVVKFLSIAMVIVHYVWKYPNRIFNWRRLCRAKLCCWCFLHGSVYASHVYRRVSAYFF